MDNVFTDVAAFLLTTLFDIYLIVMLLRILLAITKADFYNPFSQLVVSLTDPLVRPLRRIVTNAGNVDVASIVMLVILKLLQLALLSLIAAIPLSPLTLLRFSISQLLQLLVYIYIFSILIQAVMSWFVMGSAARHPLIPILHSLTEPLLKPLRRRLPIGRFQIDISPLIALLILNVILIVLTRLGAG